MKRLTFIVLLLLIVCSISVAEARTQVGVETDWFLNEFWQLGVDGGIYSVGDGVQPYGGAEMCFFLEQDPLGAHLFVKGKHYWPAEGKYQWGFQVPLNPAAYLQVGFQGTALEETWKDQIVLQTNWESKYGDLGLKSAVGSGNSEYLLGYTYPLRYQPAPRFVVQADLGVEYQWVESQGDLFLPLQLVGELELNGDISFRSEAQHRYSVSQNESEFSLGFYLQKRFQFFADEPEYDLQKVVQMVSPDVSTLNRENPEYGEESLAEGVEQSLVEKNSAVEESTPVKEVRIVQVEQVSTKKRANIEYDREGGLLFFYDQEIKVKGKKVKQQMYLPLRSLFESLGGKVYWDQETRQVYVVCRGKNLLFDLNENYLMYGGQRYPLDQPVFFKGHYYYGDEMIIKVLDQYLQESV